MKFILASDDRPALLSFAAAQTPQHGAELLDFAPVLRPVSGALRGEGSVVMPLSLTQELKVRS
jgi:hypothetical protein